MDRDEVIEALRNLRNELEQDRVLEDLTLVLFLSDVLDALALTDQERHQVLGRKQANRVENWKRQVWRPVQTETATAPATGLVAVPAG